MGTEKDTAKDLMDARADLKDALGKALGDVGELIMGKVDHLITLETGCVRRDLRVDAVAAKVHEVKVREARRTAAANRAEARALRGEEPEPPPRACSGGCGRNVADSPELTFYVNKKHPEKLRSRCTDCEKRITRDRNEQRRREAEAAGTPWPPPKVRVSAGQIRKAPAKSAAPRQAPERHLTIVKTS